MRQVLASPFYKSGLSFRWKKQSNVIAMLKRIIFGLLLIAALAVVIVLDCLMEQGGVLKIPVAGVLKGTVITAVVLLLISMCYRELSRIFVAGGHPDLGGVGLICTLMVASLPFWWQVVSAEFVRHAGPSLVVLLLTVVVLVIFIEHVIRFRTNNIISRIGGTMLAVSYLGFGGAMVLSIRIDFGIIAFTMFLVAVKTADIGAYFAGSVVGKHKLIRWLSPAKSWEGLLGGVVFSVISTVLFTIIVKSLGKSHIGISLAAIVLYAVVLALFGQVADLCESALKRDAKVKDAGDVIPTFGGVLDVLDSPLLAAPAGYVLLMILW